MGITNFCKLIDPLVPPSADPAPFDSLLIDCQSFLYVAIDHILETQERKCFSEIARFTWVQINQLLTTFSSYACASKPLTVVLSFDGEGVPMKWATQRLRRQQRQKVCIKSFYRYVLFGNNKLTLTVQRYVLKQLKVFHQSITVVLAGCNVPGEGEHKIFHLTQAAPSCCRHPIVVSVDQDVFVLAFLRLTQFETVQIYRYKSFYHVTQLVTLLPYPLRRFVDVSFLFGNDFLPVVVGITSNNVAFIHQALTFDENDDEDDANDDDAPATMAAFLRRMEKHIRYDQVEFIDRPLIVCFWMTYFWILDYYTRRTFPQQFLENRVYDAFDRNQVLSALVDESYSRSAFVEAKETYENMTTQPIPHAEQHIFTDPELLDHLKSYWIEPKNTLCTVLKLTR